MTRKARRSYWLRMTDWMGLTEPGKKPELPGPRALLFQVVGWFVSALIWLFLATRTEGEMRVWYVVLVVLSLVLTVANLVMLGRSRKRAHRSQTD